MAINFFIRDEQVYNSYDLYNGTLYASTDGWTTAVSSGVATETIKLVGADTNANLRTAFDALDDIRGQVKKYAGDMNDDIPVYLYKQTDGETLKRSRILDMHLEAINVDGNSSLLEGGGVKAILTVVRPDFWEVSSFGNKSGNNLDWTNPVLALTSVGGNVDARIDRTSCTWSAGVVSRIWMGIRPRRLGNGALGGSSDLPIAEIEDGTPDTDTSLASDATGGGAGASPYTSVSNNIHRCNFNTDQTMARRSYFRWDDTFSLTWDGVKYWAGKYKVLLRYKLSSSPTTEVLVQIKAGLSGDSSMGGTRPVLLTASGNYDLKEIGTINLPTWGLNKYGDGYYGTTNRITYTQFEIWAELVTGTGGSSTFDMDALIFIPAEYFIYVENGNLTTTSDEIAILSAVDGSTVALQEDGSNRYKQTVIASPQNWYMPYGNSDLVIAVARTATTHQLLDEVDLVFDTANSYYNYI